MYNTFERKERYEEALKLMNSSNVDDLNKAVQLFLEDGSEEACLNIEKCRLTIFSIENKIKKKRRNKKIITILASILAVILLLATIVISSISVANKKKAEKIYNNFLGETFSGKNERDDGFVSAYKNKTLNPYMTYWKTTNETNLTFKEDGSIYYESSYERVVLAYPKSTTKPEGYSNDYDGKFSSFSVSISLNGTVYLKIGSEKYKVYVDSDNIPQSIYDYNGMTLRN